MTPRPNQDAADKLVRIRFGKVVDFRHDVVVKHRLVDTSNLSL